MNTTPTIKQEMKYCNELYGEQELYKGTCVFLFIIKMEVYYK